MAQDATTVMEIQFNFPVSFPSSECNLHFYSTQFTQFNFKIIQYKFVRKGKFDNKHLHIILNFLLISTLSFKVSTWLKIEWNVIWRYEGKKSNGEDDKHTQWLSCHQLLMKSSSLVREWASFKENYDLKMMPSTYWFMFISFINVIKKKVFTIKWF